MEKTPASCAKGKRMSYCINEQSRKQLKKEVDGFLVTFSAKPLNI